MLCADEFKLWLKINSPENAQILQQDLDAIFALSVEYSPAINITKCLVMSIGNEALVAIYTIDGSPHPLAEIFKDFSVLLT